MPPSCCERCKLKVKNPILSSTARKHNTSVMVIQKWKCPLGIGDETRRKKTKQDPIAASRGKPFFCCFNLESHRWPVMKRDGVFATSRVTDQAARSRANWRLKAGCVCRLGPSGLNSRIGRSSTTPALSWRSRCRQTHRTILLG